MTFRSSCFLLLSFSLLASAKDKTKDKGALPDFVLQAHTVRVVLSPEASDPLQDPMANTRAREVVQLALQSWGRLSVVVEGDSDLVIAVRAGTGRLVAPTIERGPSDTRIGDMQPGRGEHRHWCAAGACTRQKAIRELRYIPGPISEKRLAVRMTCSRSIAVAALTL